MPRRQWRRGDGLTQELTIHEPFQLIDAAQVRSAHPADPPQILNNDLKAEADKEANRAAVHLAREIKSQTSFAPHRGAETDPGPTCASDADVDTTMAEFVSSHYHPVGTCKMPARWGWTIKRWSTRS